MISSLMFGCASISSTTGEYIAKKEQKKQAISHMYFGFKLCELAQEKLEQQQNAGNEANYNKIKNSYNAYLKKKKLATAIDPTIENHKGLFGITDFSKQRCKCESTVGEYIAKKEKEEQEKIREIEKENAIIEEYNGKRRANLDKRAKKLGYKGVKWNYSCIAYFIESVKNGKITLNDGINFIFRYGNYDECFKVLQETNIKIGRKRCDVVLYVFNAPFSYDSAADGTIIAIPKAKGSLYAEGEVLTARDGAYFGFVGVYNYRNVFNATQQALIFIPEF